MVKYFWPHTIMLILILIPRIFMFAVTVFVGYMGKPFGSPGTGWILPVVFLCILVTLIMMIIIYATN
jgi:hypothetical protein